MSAHHIDHIVRYAVHAVCRACCMPCMLYAVHACYGVCSFLGTHMRNVCVCSLFSAACAGVSQCYEYVPLPQRQGGVKAESKTLSRDHARYVKEAQKAVAKAQGELDRQAMKAALIALKPKKRPAGEII